MSSRSSVSKSESNKKVKNINYFYLKKGFDNPLLYHTCSTSHIWKSVKKTRIGSSRQARFPIIDIINMNFFGHLCHIIFMKKTKGGGGKIMSTWCVTKCMEPHYSRQFIRSKATKTPLWWSNLLGAFQFPVFPVTSQNMTTKHALYFSCQKIEYI